jgi:hypothetical protein
MGRNFKVNLKSENNDKGCYLDTVSVAEKERSRAM